MLTIYLVRHGQKHLRAGDPGLTEIGFQQANETGEYLKQFPITKIIASPHLRTVETAECIAKKLMVKHTLHDALRERINWHEGISRNQFLQEWVKTSSNRDYVSKFGTSSKLNGQKVQQLIENIDKSHTHVAVVSHGGTIVDYLRNLFNEKELSVLQKTYAEGSDFQMLNCAISTIVFTDKPKLELVNFVGHLSEKSE